MIICILIGRRQEGDLIQYTQREDEVKMDQRERDKVAGLEGL